MKAYNLPRRVWRALYPTLIHLAFLAWFLPLFYKILQQFTSVDTLYAFGTHFGLLPYILSITVFLQRYVAFFAPMALIVISALCVYALVKLPAARAGSLR
jgi:hypothetical protein